MKLPTSATPVPPYDHSQRPTGARRSLLERTPDGSTVLDVGCWSGFAGRHLVETRHAVVDGIEPDPAAAAMARESYRRVLQVGVEVAADRLVAEGTRYDTLLFMDVLEHLADPAGVLSRCLDLVEPSGRALVSIPNTAHWSVRKELLLGRWEYRDNGLLDRTHLRFYTVRTAAQLLRDSGWTITWQGASVGQPPLIRLPQRWLVLLERWPSLFAVQTLFEARPARSS
jgi:2-polyprenyl-3-methyl-5-hydroxy-6-metoxy-1,4-benzoquinol methylase